MAKSKTRRKKSSGDSSGSSGIAWGGPASTGSHRWNRIIIAGVVMASALGGYLWWSAAQAERAFLALAESGQAALQQVKSIPTQGRRHLDPGDTYVYDSPYPTSGPHALVWVPPGVYDEEQLLIKIVHALEHGNIVVNIDEPGDEAMAILESWADMYTEQWSGMIIAPRKGLGEKVVLTAWTKRLDLKKFDAAAAAAFIDAYRGRGPEHPVR